MTTTQALTLLAAVLVLAATSAEAAVINIGNHSVTPNGSTTRFQQATNINVLNGNVNVLSTSPSVAYMVSTFTFGTGTTADLAASFGN